MSQELLQQQAFGIIAFAPDPTAQHLGTSDAWDY